MMKSFDRSGEETVHTGPYGALPILIFPHDPAKAVLDGYPVDVEKAAGETGGQSARSPTLMKGAQVTGNPVCRSFTPKGRAQRV